MNITKMAIDSLVKSGKLLEAENLIRERINVLEDDIAGTNADIAYAKSDLSLIKDTPCLFLLGITVLLFVIPPAGIITLVMFIVCLNNTANDRRLYRDKISDLIDSLKHKEEELSDAKQDLYILRKRSQ